ncbi:MAG: glycosyltransferase family 4 protein [Candidatus Micrarchaeota archaeon]
MRVVFLYEKVAGFGGAERLLVEEAKYFKKRGDFCLILSGEFNKRVLDEYVKDEVEVKQIGMHRGLARITKIRDALKEFKADVVVAHTQPNHILAYLATMGTGIPYVVHMHGTSFWFPEDYVKYTSIHKTHFEELRKSCAGHEEFTPKELSANILKKGYAEVVARVDREAVRKSRRVLVLANKLKEEVKVLYGVDSVVLRAGIDQELPKKVRGIDIKEKLGISGKKMVLSISRLDARKRLDMLMRAFAKVLEIEKNAVLVIGGRGEEKENLEKLAKELKLEKEIIFPGFISEEELPDYYRCCDVFVFSAWCAYGLTVLEALAFGKNVVVTEDAYVAEILESNPNEFTCKPTEEAFVENIAKALAKTPEEKGARDAARWNWNAYFARVYDEVVNAVKRK